MFVPAKVEWHMTHIPYTTSVELTAILRSNYELPQEAFLLLVQEIIEIVKFHNGILIEPKREIPTGFNIFLTLLFDSYESLDMFANYMGFERTG